MEAKSCTIFLVFFVTAQFPLGWSTITVQRGSLTDFTNYNPVDSWKDENGPLPENWRDAFRPPSPPEIQLHLLKGRVDLGNNLSYDTEYVYAPKEYKDKEKVNDQDWNTLPNGNDQENQTSRHYNEYDEDDKSALPDLVRRILAGGPTRYCPYGQLRDHRGRCRNVISTPNMKCPVGQVLDRNNFCRLVDQGQITCPAGHWKDPKGICHRFSQG